MNTKLLTINKSDKSVFRLLILFVLMCVLLTLLQDFIRAAFHNSAFYLTEAFLFSSFWWIFIPILYGQYHLAEYKNWFKLPVFLILLPIMLHLFAFPVLVWVISCLFYYHTFAIRQTFLYTLSEHLHQIIFFYTVPVSVYNFVKGTVDKVHVTSEQMHADKEFITSLSVTQGAKHVNITVSRISYLSASTPYVIIHTEGNEYLYTASLKSVTEILNPERFVRIHKSSIVNIQHVTFYTSRLNGDYDLTMNDGTKLRISRNYARYFKQRFTESHRLDT